MNKDIWMNKNVWFTIEVKKYWITILFIVILLIIISRWKNGAIFKTVIDLTNITKILK